MIEKDALDDQELLRQGGILLQQEGRYLDEQRWDAWIDLFDSECEYWVPTWKGDETLATDPQREISHIYYSNRSGLEDRIARIRSGMSPASKPLLRTTHTISSVLPMGLLSANEMRLCSSWMTHVFSPASKKIHVFFGRSEYLLAPCEPAWRIKKKKVILMNDYVPGMLDVYCL